MRRKGTTESLIRHFTSLTPEGRRVACRELNIPLAFVVGRSDGLPQAQDMANYLAASGRIRAACAARGC